LLRIVGLQRDPIPEREFVLLQNQGSMRVTLRGHAILSEMAISSNRLSPGAFAFSVEESIPSGMYVLLRTGFGEPKWGKTKEGQLVYHAFMNRAEVAWPQESGALHVLKTQHTFSERPSDPVSIGSR
jgi:hypothetical protein